jgi:hypothetical protein
VLPTETTLKGNRSRIRKALVAVLVLIVGQSCLIAQGTPTASPPEGCAQFVQQFYDWYLAKEKALMDAKSEDSAFEVTLRDKQASFSPGLVQALKDDLEASKKSSDEVVGLDFDPFLNSQDTAEKYVVGEVHPKGDHYYVDVFGVWEGKKNPKPDVVPELALEKGKWIFTNFHYQESDIPVNENLVSVLQQLKKDREKPPK